MVLAAACRLLRVARCVLASECGIQTLDRQWPLLPALQLKAHHAMRPCSNAMCAMHPVATQVRDCWYS